MHIFSISADIDYFNEQNKLQSAYDKLRSNEYIVPSSVSSWYVTYMTWVNTTYGNTANVDKGNPSNFLAHLTSSFIAFTVFVVTACCSFKAARCLYSLLPFQRFPGTVVPMFPFLSAADSCSS